MKTCPCRLLLIAGLGLCLATPGIAEEARPAPGNALEILSGYPKSPALDSIVGALDGITIPADQGRWVVEGTYFKEGNTTHAAKCAIDDRGRVSKWTSVFSRAEQGPVMGFENPTLSKTQMEALQNSLRALPPNARPASLADVLILNFRDGAAWVTRIYDRSQLPAPVNAIYALTRTAEGLGTPVETAKKPVAKAYFDTAPLRRQVLDLVHRYYPQAAQNIDGDGILFEYNTRTFMVHTANMLGDWQEAQPQIGPKRGGIYGYIGVHPGHYEGQAVVPQSFDIRYFTTYFTAIDSKQLDAYLSVHISYPQDVAPGFLKELTALLDNFENHVSRRN